MTGYEALRTKAAWFDASKRGKLRLTGEDHIRLLHAMSTNDAKGLAEGAGLYTFFLNDKGRILADAYLYRFAESALLDTEPETAALLAEHLDRYIIADDAAVENQTQTLAAIAVEGPASLETAAELGMPIPPAAFATLPWQGGFVARVSATGAEGLRVFLPPEEAASLMSNLAQIGLPQAEPDAVRLVRLENGKPRFGEDISARFLAPETRIAEAVHPNKGCYLGQEIVERVRAQGQVHRLLAPVRIAGQNAPEAGVKLLSDGQPVAEITSAAYSPALGEVVGLAYVRREALERKPPLTVAGSETAARVA